MQYSNIFQTHKLFFCTVLAMRETYKSDQNAQTLRLKVHNNKPKFGIRTCIDPIMCMSDTQAV